MTTSWKSKLTSRKFWMSVCGFVTPLVITFGGTEGDAARITGLVMAGAAVIAYIIGEGFADCSAAKKSTEPAAADIQKSVLGVVETDSEFEKGVG